MHLFTSAILVFLCCQFGNSAPLTEVKELTVEDIKEVLTNKVPQDEWQTYLKEETYIGYEIQQEGKDWEDREEAELAVGIFHYFVNHQEEIRKKKELSNEVTVRDVICFAEPIGCIDTDDSALRPTA